jgi:hypothetical protein
MVATIGLLALTGGGGRDVLFSVLVGLHVLAALVGFGSVAFAGTFAGRAAHFEPMGAGQAAAPQVGADPAPMGNGAPDGSAETEAGDPGAAEVLGQGGATVHGQGTAEGSGGDQEAEELLAYFERPARLWWALLLVPWLGMGALAADPHGGGLGQGWVIGAGLIWLLAALVAASLVVPALWQVRSMLARAVETGGLGAIQGAQRIRLARAGGLASRAAAFCDVLFFCALVLMIWRP